MSLFSVAIKCELLFIFLLEFSENIKQDAFSDRVYASLYTLAESQDGEAQETTVVEQVESPDVGVTSQDAGTVSTEDSAEEKLYYAVLVGFGARSSADKYVNSLKNRGVSARSIERTSTTSRGSKRSWYQVVTEPASLEQAQEWVHRISTTDKLQGVVIKEYEKTT